MLTKDENNIQLYSISLMLETNINVETSSTCTDVHTSARSLPSYYYTLYSL